jgi:hypothetical protein
MRQSPNVLFCIVAAMALAAGCAGYQVGTRSLHYPSVRTVYVPIFESDSYRRNLGEQLTEAVAKHLELKTSYKVVSDPTADSVLNGRIVTETKRAVTLRRTGEPRDIETQLRVQINWTDRRGQLLGQAYSVAVPSLLADISGASDAVPEAGQSIALAHQKAIDRLAEQIVSQLEMPW